MEGAPSSVDLVRSQAGTHEARRAAHRHRCVQRKSGAADEVALQLQAIRPVGRVGLREVSERGEARGRFCVHQIALQRVERSRAGALPDQHGHRAARLSERGRVDHLRAGQREPESSGLRGARQQPGGEGRAAQLERGISADQLSGHAVPLVGRADSQSHPARARHARRPAGAARFSQEGQHASISSSTRANRTCSRAFRASSWRIACKWRPAT